MKFLIAVLSLLALAACAPSKSGTNTAAGEDVGQIPNQSLTALNAKPYSKATLKFFKLDMTPLTNPATENDIMVCTSDMEFCRSQCVSVYYPEVERYSVFKTSWLTGNKCVAYAIQYPDGVNVPKMRYYEGTYAGSTCTINVNSPDFVGGSAWTNVKVPQGQTSPAPDNKRDYYLHNWTDNSGAFVNSVYMYEFNPPASWAYEDSSVAAGWITPQLVAGSSCIKQSEIQ